MPPLAAEFGRHVSDALLLAEAGDLAAAQPVGSPVRSEWHIWRAELLYELAYLRIFIQWETLLEQVFPRYLCGYVSIAGTGYAAISGTFSASLQDAEARLLGGRQYVLWHNPREIVGRAKNFLVNCPHETTIASYSAQLGDLAAVRHRIAHGQPNAKQRFDIATANFAGRRYRGARPGRFLRDWDRSAAPPRRWLATLGTELRNVAQQLV
jgi:hypothetical protein